MVQPMRHIRTLLSRIQGSLDAHIPRRESPSDSTCSPEKQVVSVKSKSAGIVLFRGYDSSDYNGRSQLQWPSRMPPTTESHGTGSDNAGALRSDWSERSRLLFPSTVLVGKRIVGILRMANTVRALRDTGHSCCRNGHPLDDPWLSITKAGCSG
jgi:hypothetical protein